MALHRISASARIPAPAARVYSILSDYRNGHPRILPKPPFVTLVVEEGGIGAGTIIRFEMKAMGRSRAFRAAVSEPEQGRVLVETDLDSGAVTTFTVEPSGDGNATHVTIETETNVRSGLPGTVEKWLMTRLLQPTYAKELSLLARVTREE